MHKSDAEYLILKKFQDNPYLTQRELSKELGVSLGKTNYIINALIDKGWLKLKNFKRSDKKLGYSYLLTTQGITEKAILAQKFLKKKSDEYNRLKVEIENLRNEL
jgi:EPS-associated MarR family transcriptional regulator